MLLARHGIRSLVVERHPGTSILPHAFGANVRTMEIFRVLGLEEAIHGRRAGVAGPVVPVSVHRVHRPGSVVVWAVLLAVAGVPRLASAPRAASAAKASSAGRSPVTKSLGVR